MPSLFSSCIRDVLGWESADCWVTFLEPLQDVPCWNILPGSSVWEWLGCPPPMHKDTPFPFPGHKDVETYRLSDASATFDCIPWFFGTWHLACLGNETRQEECERREMARGSSKERYLSLSHFLDKRLGAVWLWPQISPWSSKRWGAPRLWKQEVWWLKWRSRLFSLRFTSYRVCPCPSVCAAKIQLVSEISEAFVVQKWL